MSNENFDSEVLAEKLSKLNNSAQSIESLSQWCVSHRKKARQVVETWDKSFNSSQKEKCIYLLYLANDILQNSRRKGSEFVNEFWKVLPTALKHVYGKGDGHGKKVVMRLVNIWEERRVFGSRGHGLKDELMGKDAPLPSISNVKSSNPIKIVKRDANSLRIKLAVGGLPEKIITAFQSVLEEKSDEEIALNKFNIAAQEMGKIEKDVESALAQGYQQGSTLENDLQDQENVLLQCIGQLESAEANRAVLVTQLKEALCDQESKLELLRSQLQVARRQIELAGTLHRRIATPSSSAPVLQTASTVFDLSRLTEPNLSAPIMSFASQKTTSDEDSKKAAVAAIAAKLTASTSSAQMLTSVLSSLVAEEMNGGSKFTEFFPPEKRPKLDNSEASNTDIRNNPSSYFAPLQSQLMMSSPLAPSTVSAQYVHSAALMAMPYGYVSSPLPPPPPMPIPLARPLPPQHAQLQQEQPQQPGTAGGYYHPHGVGFFGQSHQSATASPLPRQ